MTTVNSQLLFLPTGVAFFPCLLHLVARIILFPKSDHVCLSVSSSFILVLSFSHIKDFPFLLGIKIDWSLSLPHSPASVSHPAVWAPTTLAFSYLLSLPQGLCISFFFSGQVPLLSVLPKVAPLTINSCNFISPWRYPLPFCLGLDSPLTTCPTFWAASAVV